MLNRRNGANAAAFGIEYRYSHPTAEEINKRFTKISFRTIPKTTNIFRAETSLSMSPTASPSPPPGQSVALKLSARNSLTPPPSRNFRPRVNYATLSFNDRLNKMAQGVNINKRGQAQAMENILFDALTAYESYNLVTTAFDTSVLSDRSKIVKPNVVSVTAVITAWGMYKGVFKV